LAIAQLPWGVAQSDNAFDRIWCPHSVKVFHEFPVRCDIAAAPPTEADAGTPDPYRELNRRIASQDF